MVFGEISEILLNWAGGGACLRFIDSSWEAASARAEKQQETKCTNLLCGYKSWAERSGGAEVLTRSTRCNAGQDHVFK